MTSVTPDSIFQVASGFMASKHLYVANEVGLFEQLAEGPLHPRRIVKAERRPSSNDTHPGRCYGRSGLRRSTGRPLSERSCCRHLSEWSHTRRPAPVPALLESR